MTFSKTALALACGLTFSVSANAALFVEDGSGGDIPDTAEKNHILGDSSAEQPAGYGANLYSDGSTEVTFEFLGKEASYDNNFYVGEELVFSNYGSDASSEGDSYTTVFTDGVLEFAFESEENGFAYNGSNPDDSEGEGNAVNFFVAEQTTEYGEGLFLAFDDNGANDDDNHDDMVIQVTSSKVPEPGTLALMGLGLAGLGIGYRRRT